LYSWTTCSLVLAGLQYYYKQNRERRITKRKRWRDGKIKGKEKRKKMGEMVGIQTANQAANTFKKGKEKNKKTPGLEQ
jgi:hypothetical protein